MAPCFRFSIICPQTDSSIFAFCTWHIFGSAVGLLVGILHKDKLQAFLDSNEPQSMVISPNIAGHLHIHTDWPSALRNKGVYFVKKEKTPIPEDEVILTQHL